MSGIDWEKGTITTPVGTTGPDWENGDIAEPSTGGFVSDIGKSLKVGIQKLPGAVTGLLDIPNALAYGKAVQDSGISEGGQKWITRAFTTAADALGEATGFQPGKWANETKFSQGYNDSRQRVDKAWEGADKVVADPSLTLGQKASGVVAELPGIAAEYLKNPGYTANQVVESLPAMLASSGISRPLMMAGSKVIPAAEGVAARAIPGALERKLGEQTAAAVAGGIGEGVMQVGQQMDSHTDGDQFKNAVAALGSGAVDAVISAGGGRAAQSLGLETPETLMAKGFKNRVAATGSVARNVLGGAVAEGGLQELPQSMQEQAFGNWAEGKPLGEGVLRAGAEGALAGGIMGAGANVQMPRVNREQDTQAPPQSTEGTPAPTAPLLLGNQPPDRLFVFPDGTVGRTGEVESYLANLPEDQRADARAKLMGQNYTEVNDPQAQQARRWWENYADGAVPAQRPDYLAEVQAAVRSGTPFTTQQTVDTVRNAMEDAWLAQNVGVETAPSTEPMAGPQAADAVGAQLQSEFEQAGGDTAVAAVDARVRTGRILSGLQNILDTGAENSIQVLNRLNEGLAKINEAPLAGDETARVRRVVDAYMGFRGAGEPAPLPDFAPKAVDVNADNASMEALIPERPSQRMGLDPAAGALSRAAVQAVDGGLHDTLQLQRAQEQAAQVEAGGKPKNFREAIDRIRAEKANAQFQTQGNNPQALQAEATGSQTAAPVGGNGVAAPGLSGAGDAGTASAGLTASIPSFNQPTTTNGPQTAQAQQATPQGQTQQPATEISASSDEQAFSPETGTLGIPRADMPQVPTQSHGGLVKHLNAKGIAHETTTVNAADLKPTQAEYSPAKVEAAKTAGGDRAVIVSSDGHIIDGHHQAMAAAEEGKPVKAIVLDAPVEQALDAVKNSPSAQPKQPTQPTDTNPEDYKGHHIYSSAIGNDKFIARERNGKQLGKALGAYDSKEQARAAVDAKVGAQPEKKKSERQMKPGMHVGTTPATAEPVTVRDGVVYVGKYEALDYDTGEPITVPDGSSRAEVAKALKDGGALSSGQKLFGLNQPDEVVGPKFSQGLLSPRLGPKPALEQVQRLVDMVQKVSKNVLPVSVIGNPSQIPGVQVPVGTKPTGALIDGHIYLFADNLKSVGDAYVTLFHEIFHLGLQKVIPAEDYAVLLQKFVRSLPVQRFVREWKASPEGVQKAATMPSAAYEALAAEEALAMVSEELASNNGIGTNTQSGLVKSMLSWLAATAERLGFPANFGDWVRGLTRTDAEKFVSDMTRAAMGGDRNLARTKAKYGTVTAEMTAQTRLSAGKEEDSGIRHSRPMDQTKTANFKRWFGDWEATKVNESINKAIEQWGRGELKSGKILTLGHPSDVLLKFGVPDLPIHLTQRILTKAVKQKHDVDLSDLKDLALNIQAPIAVFKSKRGDGHRVVVTEARHADGNVIVALELEKTRDGLEVNDITSIHPKRDGSVAQWLEDGFLMGYEKSKGREWLENSAGSNSRQPQDTAAFDGAIVYETDSIRNPSKVVDAEGKPLVVYHGTGADFSTFDRTKAKRGNLGEGFYFTPNPDEASTFAGKSTFNKDGGNVVPAYISLKNPAIVRGADTGAELAGHDGIIQIGEDGRIKTVVAFHPEQIKSAIGNNGNFDPNDGDITHSRPMDADMLKRMFTPMAPLSVAETQAAVADMVKGWKNAPRLRVVAKASEMPGNPPSDARGQYLNGTVWIVASAHRSAGNVQRTLAHEAIAHHGLREMLGGIEHERMMRTIQQGIARGDKGLLELRGQVRQAYVDEQGRFNLTPDQEADEIAARAVEVGFDAKTGEFRPGFEWVKRVYARIAQFLRNLGLNVTFTNAELQGMLAQAQQFLTKPARGESMVVGPEMAAMARNKPSDNALMPENQAPGPQGDAQQGANKGNAVANKKAPTSDTSDAYAGRPQGGMQERAVRAVTGSPELAQSGFEAGSEADINTLPDGVVKKALVSANKEIAAQYADDLQDAIRDIEENGSRANLSKLAENPEYWDAENEEFTAAGLEEMNRLYEQEAKDSLGISEAKSLDDINDVHHFAQADAFRALLDGLGFEYVEDGSQSKYFTIHNEDGDGVVKFRFADHGNTVKNTAIGQHRILFNVSPGNARFTDAVGRLLQLKSDQSAPVSGGAMYSRSVSTKAAYETRIDALFSGGKATTGTRVLDRSDVMGLLGYPDVPLMLNERHLLDGLTNHPEMTAAMWKQVPDWIENPAMVYRDPRDSGRIVMIAPKSVAGYPVMLVVEPNPIPSQRGKAQPFQLLVTAYAKTGGKIPAPGFLASSGNLLYLDMKNAPDVLQRAGVQFPGQAALQRGRNKILTEKNLAGWRKNATQPTGAVGAGFDASNGANASEKGKSPETLVPSRLQLPGVEQESRGTDQTLADQDGPAYARGPSDNQTVTPDGQWQTPAATWFDNLVYKLQDKHIDTKRILEAITATAGKISDALNVYLQEELFHGRAATRVNDFGAHELKPLLNQMRILGLQMSDVEEFLHARHAKEANALIAGRNEDMPDGGSGMTNQAADDYFRKLDPGQRAKLEMAAAKVDAIIAKTRQLYADYGLEDQSTVDGWGEMFQHYVPLMREDKDGGMGIGQGFSIKGKETKGRTGSTRKVVDILANVAAQRERVIVRGEKNRVSRALLGLAQANPNADFWEVRTEPPTEKVYDAKLDKVVERPDGLFKQLPNVVTAKVRDSNGRVTEQAVILNEDDPRAMRMAQALKNLDAGNLEGLLGVSAKVTRYFAAVNTQYNPVFGVVNLMRDVQTAMVNLAATPLAGQQGRIAADTAAALKGIYRDVRAARKGDWAKSEWSDLWEQFQADGGTTGYRELFRTSADRTAQLQHVLTPEGWMDSKLGRFFTADGRLRVPMSQAQKGAEWLFGWLSDYNEAMENAVRLATYKAALDNGMSREQSASLAKNLTVNFNRRGQVGLQAGALYAFFNAAMQGTARIGQTLFDMENGKPNTLRLSAVGKKVVLGGVTLGALQTVMLAAAGFGDDDPPDFVRERALIIPTGGKTYVSIPMPLGLHVLPGIGRHATEFALSGFEKPAQRVAALVGMFADAFNPIGSAGMSIQTIAPTAIDPLVALSENRDWTGKPIARVSSNKAVPGHTQWKDTATTWSKLIAEGINYVTGGNDYVAGVFSPTPDQIDYLIAQLTGGVGREASKVDQTARSLITGEDLPSFKIPLVGRLVGNADSQASQGNAFYANLDRLNEIETEVKGLRKDGRGLEAARLMRDRPEARLIQMANHAERQVQKLRRDKRELVEKGAGQEAVRAKEQQITAVMTRLNKAMEQAMAR